MFAKSDMHPSNLAPNERFVGCLTTLVEIIRLGGGGRYSPIFEREILRPESCILDFCHLKHEMVQSPVHSASRDARDKFKSWLLFSTCLFSRAKVHGFGLNSPGSFSKG